MDSVKQIYEKLVRSKRPIDFFGKIANLEELKKAYRRYAKLIHPDIVKSNEKYIACEAFAMLSKINLKAEEEFENGLYEIVNVLDLYKLKDPMFEIKIKDVQYKFYEHFFDGEVADVFRGTDGSNLLYLKLAKDYEDNDLLEQEFDTLKKVVHQSLVVVRERIIINDCTSIIMDEVMGTSMLDILKEYPRGIDAEHLMWMMERLLSVVGYLHFNMVVHGNIKPEHIIINKDNHNVSLVGFSFSIPKANTKDARYMVKNDIYSAPEVSKTAIVLPNSDIYSIGKIAIELLGGDVKRNGMPISVNEKIRTFIRKMVEADSNKRPNDAWKLWDEVRILRTEVYGNTRFKKFN